MKALISAVAAGALLATPALAQQIQTRAPANIGEAEQVGIDNSLLLIALAALAVGVGIVILDDDNDDDLPVSP